MCTGASETGSCSLLLLGLVASVVLLELLWNCLYLCYLAKKIKIIV